MSIGFWKSTLGLAKAGAALLILASAFLFWRHRQEMTKPFTPPDFAPPVAPVPARVARIESLSIPLGRFQRETGSAAPAVETPAEPVFESELQKLCEITDAIVVYPPYAPGGLEPAIVIKYKQRPPGETSDVRTVRRGEALVERPRPDSPQHRVAVRHLFLGCERDPEHPGWTYFLFDVKCDGTDVQRARWKLEGEPQALPAAKPEAADRGSPISGTHIYVGPPVGAAGATEGRPAPETRPPATVEPVPVPEPLRLETPGSLFDDEEGALALTPQGLDYLEKNYEKILEETRTQTYRDREGRAGVRIVAIKHASVANQFGLMKDDVILSINGISVGTQSEAVNVVKGELRKRPAVRYITARILRHGRVLEKRYDTRDPATRRAAERLR